MKVDSILEIIQKIREEKGGEYDIIALDDENNTYDFSDIVYHEGLEVYGIKFE